MRKISRILIVLLTAVTLMASCKDRKVTTPAEERIQENHPTEVVNTSSIEGDTLQVIKDSVVDHNMKGQSDTHGRDTDAGR